MASRQKHGATLAPVVDDTLSQADLSHLRIQDMTPEERAELRRRYDAFVRHFGHGATPIGATKRKSRARKWTPKR